MKLVVLLMLVAIPLCCYAGSGCTLLENIIAQTINPAVSVSQYQELVKPFVNDAFTKNAIGQMKQCFLNQSNETLANVQVLMNAIYNSSYCAPY
ncbi:mammaglobin-A-like [Castor canadensis]|uniref:Mammaglobin-A-like n=1 Tax=Castor canadensis TaxID=51338 RepID=A0AC58M8F2_CASCN